MNKSFIAFLVGLALATALSVCSLTEQPLKPNYAWYKPKVQLIAAAQDLTTGWVNLGEEFDARAYSKLALFLNVDINDSNDVRIKILCQHTIDGDWYQSLIYTPSASKVAIEFEYYEFNVDADINAVLSTSIIGCGYVKIQVQVSAVGGTAGQIDDAYYTLAFN